MRRVVGTIGQVRFFLLVLIVIGISCASPSAPTVPDGAIRVNGTVQYFNLEGGFWAIRGENGVTYDPLNGLSPSFQRENLPVTLVARVRSDVGGIHMVGPIVEVLSIQER
jgi:hypothetical protein